MAKVKIAKQHWGYIIPTLLLIAGGIFLFYKSGYISKGTVSGGYKSYGYYAAGKKSDDLDVRNIRWHQHNGYERLVFDIYKWDGVLGSLYMRTNETGLYQIGREKGNSKTIDGELSGYRAFSADMPSFAKSKIMQSMEIYPNDDGTFLFAITLKKDASYKVFTLKNPARIIIDAR